MLSGYILHLSHTRGLCRDAAHTDREDEENNTGLNLGHFAEPLKETVFYYTSCFVY